jgi:hypothetical protein
MAMCPERSTQFVSCSCKSNFIINAQNILHEIECTSRLVSPWTVTSIQRFLVICGESDRHPQCDDQVRLRCQEELHTHGILGVPTTKIPRDSNLAKVEAMQLILLYLSIGHDRYY